MNVLASGSFDVFHPGHCEFLRRAALLGTLYVAVNTDESIRRTKGPTRPVFTLSERIVMLTACRYVSGVYPFDTEQELEQLCRDFSPCIRCVGDDHVTVTGAGIAKSVVTLPRGSYSTTGIIERIHHAGH